VDKPNEEWDGPVYPYPSDPKDQTPGDARRFPFTAAGGFLAALVLVAAGVGVYFGVSALTSKEKGEPFSLSGTVSLRTDDITTSGLPSDFACAGKGGYNDLRPGTAVTVSDETGTLLAKGTLDSSFGEKTWCVFAFDVQDVPSGAKFYKVQVSHRDEMSYTEQEARGRIEISLGDAPSEESSAPPPPAAPPPVAAPAPAPAPAPPPAPRGPVPADRPDTVPAYSTQCSPGVAVGSSKTSCAFAQVVRNAYVSQSRGGTVVIYPYSPVTRKTYEMTCTGRDVVTCTGGDNAVVYLY
jgi:hypothetical protein